MFYAFAQLKTPLAEQAGVTTSDILVAVTGALLIQAFLAPIIGNWIDRYGALIVMSRGLMIGAAGMAALPIIDKLWWIWFCMAPIGLGFAMSSYETAFSAAVQMNEDKARQHISFITFYGGVASSVIWLSIAPLLESFGLTTTCLICAAVLVLMALRTRYLQHNHPFQRTTDGLPMTPFRWVLMTRDERYALIALATSSALEYFVFASTTLLWIAWFTIHFENPGIAIILGALYGPFQTIGRLLEMKFGQGIDARITGIIAFFGVPTALILVQQDSLAYAIIAMIIFGMGHGILTVSFGYVTNMYFGAAVYGRAKGWITTPRAIGNAIGPSVGGVLFLIDSQIFFNYMIGISILSAASFATLFLTAPRKIKSVETK